MNMLCANPSCSNGGVSSEVKRTVLERNHEHRPLAMSAVRGYVLDAQIHRVVSDGKDPLILIAAERDILRRRKRRVT